MREVLIGYVYYVVLREGYTREDPLAVLRREPFPTGGGTDEVFTGSAWRRTPILIEADHGDLMYDFVEIEEDEAQQLMRGIADRKAPPGEQRD